MWLARRTKQIFISHDVACLYHWFEINGLEYPIYPSQTDGKCCAEAMLLLILSDWSMKFQSRYYPCKIFLSSRTNYNLLNIEIDPYKPTAVLGIDPLLAIYLSWERCGSSIWDRSIEPSWVGSLHYKPGSEIHPKTQPIFQSSWGSRSILAWDRQ